MTVAEIPDAQRVADALAGQYLAVRVLADGSVAALGELLFTRAIFLGCSELGFECRFCFQDRELASRVFHELASEDDVPEGYTARRGG